MARILVVDDDPLILELLKETVDSEEHDVVVASDMAEALSRAAAHPPDLVVLDLDLPGATGREIMARLRRAGSTAPVVVLTGSGRAREAELLAAGAAAYLTKPFSPLELVRTLEAAVARRP